MDPTPPRSNRNSPESSENVTSPSENDADAAEDSDSSKSSDAGDNSKIIRVVSENSKEMERESSGTNKPRKSRKSIGPFFKLPVIFTYPAKNRPKQPFMNQPPAQPPIHPITNSPPQLPIRPALRQSTQTPSRNVPPPPPPYYSNQVTEEYHQPQQLIGGQPTERPRGRSVNFQGVETQQEQPPQMGQLAIMPNALSNIAYWAPYPDQIPNNVPACLAHLVAADCLFIVQQLDVIELFISVDEPNFYLIQNKEGQCVYYAYETSEICGQMCCTHSRGFQLHVMDMYHNEIIYMNRPCGFNSFFCCYPVLEVYSPPLVPVGAIQKVFHPTHQQFIILDADENKMFKIHGPCIVRTCNCCVEAEFTIHALDSEETEVGVIRREWGGLIRTYFTNADYYGITFPVDLDVRIKAVFLGALFFIDYTFYEDT